MIRILKNKTANEALVRFENVTIVVEAGNERDLGEVFLPWQLASIDGLVELLGQGTDKFVLNDGVGDLSVARAIDLVRGYMPQKGPQAVDGKQYVSPDMWPLGLLTNFTGAADDVAAGVVGSDVLVIESTQVEDKTKIVQFIESSFLAGGQVQYKNATLGDAVSFQTIVPGTVGTDVGAGQGAYAKSPIGGGLSLFAPYPGGGWDLDLAEKENANVNFTKVRPVPSPGSQGFFDWNEETGEVTVNAAGQKGGYHLIDGDIAINELVTKVPILGDDHFQLTVPAVRPVRLLPHWRFVLTLRNSSAKSLQLAAMLYRGKGNVL
jgi:hypothetical protein